MSQEPAEGEEDGHEATTGVKESHVAAFVSAARPPSPGKHHQLTALMIGDSHQKTLIPEILEQGLGCSLTHGIFPSPSRASNHLGGHPRRAYNSSRNYPNALFIEGSQESRCRRVSTHFWFWAFVQTTSRTLEDLRTIFNWTGLTRVQGTRWLLLKGQLGDLKTCRWHLYYQKYDLKFQESIII